jgi:hypothetical protein
MALHHGKDGEVEVGGVKIGKLTNWTLVTEIATVDVTTAGEDWETHLTGAKKWSGTIDVNFDEEDTGQAGLDLGAVTLKLYEEGDVAGATEYAGTATITQKTGTVGHTEKVTHSFSFTGNGALASATVSA